MKTAIYPGSFDPITLGHIDIIERGCKVFDKLIVAVMTSNIEKTPLFSLNEKLEMINLATAHIKNIEITSSSGLLVDFAKKHSTTTILKGLRSPSDFEAEHQMASLNQMLSPDIDTLFFVCKDEHRFISSTVVRQLMHYKGDFSSLVHHTTNNYIKKRGD